jgi:CHAD domain-containing protein
MKPRVRPDRPLPDLCAHLARALKRQAKRYRKRLRRCQRRFSPAAVHDSRVETRRMEALLELVSELVNPSPIKKARRGLKAHLDALDRLRDTQVQLSYLARWRRRFAAARLFAAHLEERERRRAAKARRHVRAIKPARLNRLTERILRALLRRAKDTSREEVWAIALQAAETAFGEVKRLRDRLDAAHPETIHRMRIAFKRFRYMVEAMAPVLTGVSKAQLAAMHEFQATMGRIQDLEVLGADFEAFAKKHDLADETARPFRAWLQRRQAALIQQFLRRADRVNAFWPPIPRRAA